MLLRLSSLCLVFYVLLKYFVPEWSRACSKLTIDLNLISFFVWFRMNVPALGLGS